MIDNQRYGSAGRRRFLKATAGAASLVGVAGCTGSISGSSSEFPSDDIEMIVPWSAGGGTDRTARKLAEVGEQYTESPVFVTNKTGGGGVIGFEEIRNSRPDGHRIGVMASTMMVLHHYGRTDITYEDFAPIMQYNADPASITVHESAPYDSVEGFVEHAKENRLKVGSAGPGDIWHLAAVGFGQEAGVEFDYVSYDGSAPALTAVVNGEVDVSTTSVPEAAPQVEDGPLKLIASMGEERHYQFPDTPTVAEKGYDWNLSAWRALIAPSGVEEDRIETLHEIFSSTYENDDFRSFMENNGFNLAYRNHDDLGRYMKSQHDRIGEVVERAGAGN